MVRRFVEMKLLTPDDFRNDAKLRDCLLTVAGFGEVYCLDILRNMEDDITPRENDVLLRGAAEHGWADEIRRCLERYPDAARRGRKPEAVSLRLWAEGMRIAPDCCWRLSRMPA